MGSAVPVARRALLADRRRLVISTLGVGLAVALILLLQGLWGGVLAGVSAYPDSAGADLFVREPKSQNLVVGTVPLTALQSVRAVPGVQRADPVLARYVILTLHDSKEAVSVVGFEPGGLGGPWLMAEGRAPRGPDEVALDRSLADAHDIGLGDAVMVQGRRFKVVGLSSRTRTLMGGGYVFITVAAAQRLFGMPAAATFVLVRTSTPGPVAAEIRDRTGLAADRPGMVAADQRAVYARALGRIFRLLIVIAFAAGTLIVALTVYSVVVDRLPEYGVIKAMGAGRGRLFGIVAGQTLALSAAGTLAGILLFAVISRALVAVRPQDATVLTPAALGLVILAAGAMALLAAALPALRVARLDPASVYRR